MTESTRCGGAGTGEAVFRLVVTAPRVVPLDTVGSDFDTTPYVRRGSCASGRELDCNDDGANDARAAKLALGALMPGKDDDCDGKVDCADDDCSANPDHLLPAFRGRMPSRLRRLHTDNLCAIFAPGSNCNETTRQCEC